MVTHASIAKADNLVIQDDGNIILVITTDGVLGVSTTTAPQVPAKSTAPVQQSNPPQQNKPQSVPPQPQHTETKQQSSPQSPTNSSPQIPAKTIPIVPPHTESTVQINPPINNDKKVQVTITTGTSAQTPPPITIQPAAQIKKSLTSPAASPSRGASKTSVTLTPAPTNTPSTSTTAVTETVDQVVAQGTNGKPVLSITSAKANQLTIQQGTTQVTTALPLQIDTLTHSLSIPSQNESTKVNVLPTEAMQGILDKGILTTQNVNQAKIDLTNGTSGVDYTVSSQKQGKLFGLFPVQSPVQVTLSAQNGKVVKTSQSLLFNLFGGLIK